MPQLPDITTADEFIRLRTSDNRLDNERSEWAAMPSPVWQELLSEHPEMKFWLAHNRTTPPEILAELARDADWRVRHRVAQKNACPPELRELLSHDEHDAVRSAATRRREPRRPSAN